MEEMFWQPEKIDLLGFSEAITYTFTLSILFMGICQSQTLVCKFWKRTKYEAPDIAEGWNWKPLHIPQWGFIFNITVKRKKKIRRFQRYKVTYKNNTFLYWFCHRRKRERCLLLLSRNHSGVGLFLRLVPNGTAREPKNLRKSYSEHKVNYRKMNEKER